LGTSGAYGGSGGNDWRRARAAARRVREQPSSQSIGNLINNVATAAGWNPAEGDGLTETPGDSATPVPSAIPPARPSTFRIPEAVIARGLAGLGISVVGAAGAAARGGGRSGGAVLSGQRSPRRVARTAARVIGSGYGLQLGDAARLTEVGLDLNELRALDPFDQSLRILDTLAAGSSIQDEELRRALADVLVVLQDSGGTVVPEEIVRAFVVGYVFQVVCTESGAELREADDPADIERQIREYLEVRAHEPSVINLSRDARTVTVALLETSIRALIVETAQVFVR